MWGSQAWDDVNKKWTKTIWLPLTWILFVDSRKRVSWGDILWKTTFWMLDLPLLLVPIKKIRDLLLSLANASSNESPNRSLSNTGRDEVGINMKSTRHKEEDKYSTEHESLPIICVLLHVIVIPKRIDQRLPNVQISQWSLSTQKRWEKERKQKSQHCTQTTWHYHDWKIKYEEPTMWCSGWSTKWNTLVLKDVCEHPPIPPRGPFPRRHLRLETVTKCCQRLLPFPKISLVGFCSLVSCNHERYGLVISSACVLVVLSWTGVRMLMHMLMCQHNRSING